MALRLLGFVDGIPHITVSATDLSSHKQVSSDSEAMIWGLTLRAFFWHVLDVHPTALRSILVYDCI